MPKGLVAHALEWLGVDAGEGGYEPLDSLAGEVDAQSPHSGTKARSGSNTKTAQAISCPIVRAEPRSMEEATAVGDEIKRQNPVVLNLEGVEREEARRIRDFLGGVTYGLNGYMRKLGSWVYICAPFDMPIERLLLDPSRRGEDRFEEDYSAEFADYEY